MTPITSRQVQGDIYRFLVDSDISTMVSGGVYRSGMRPRDSRVEDAVVTFVAGLSNMAVQTGVVVVNIYVPDIDPWGNGVLTEDSRRTEEIEAAAARWVTTLTCDRSNYKFRLAAAIQTFEDNDIHQHFVSVRLGYEYWDGE